MRFLFFLLIVLVGCGREDHPFSFYINNLPEQESINASLLNYENIVENLKSNVEKKQYLAAISNGFDFFQIFEEEDDQGYINHYLHQALQSTITNDNYLSFFDSLSSQQKKLLHLTQKKENGKEFCSYQNEFLQQQLNERIGYQLEMEAAEQIHIHPLFDKGLSSRNEKTNEKLKAIEMFYRRFPNSEIMHGYLQTNANDILNGDLSNLSKKKKKELEELESWINYISTYQFSKTLVGFSYLQGDFITLRNKTNYLFSRKLFSFDSWEEVELLKTSSNCLESGWINVRFGEHIGFLEMKYLQTSDAPTNEMIYFRQAQSLYLQKKYLQSAEASAKCIRKATHQSIKERGILLLEHCHLEIAKRATSKNNPFLKYVLTYPKYFRVSESELDLTTSLFLFDFLRKINDNSVFLNCFFKKGEY